MKDNQQPIFINPSRRNALVAQQLRWAAEQRDMSLSAIVRGAVWDWMIRQFGSAKPWDKEENDNGKS